MNKMARLIKRFNKFILLLFLPLWLGACSSVSIHWMRFDHVQGIYSDGTQKVIKANKDDKDIDNKEIISKPVKILTDNMGLVVKFHY